MDQYVYYETDPINEIFFLTQGFAGFVLPFQSNVVYIEILNGNQFGEIDFEACVKANNMDSLSKMFDHINEKINLMRQFTIQSI